eukprot:356822-Lingulodinium_polyedra.AAC.1
MEAWRVQQLATSGLFGLDLSRDAWRWRERSCPRAKRAVSQRTGCPSAVPAAAACQRAFRA